MLWITTRLLKVIGTYVEKNTYDWIQGICTMWKVDIDRN